MLHRPSWLLAAFLFAAVPTAAFAQTENYVPAKMVRLATGTTPIAGDGSVTVQVLVHKDGTFAVQKVLKSTAPAFNAVALDIAKRSSYSPATRNGQPVEAVADFTINFTGGSAQAGNGSSPETDAAFASIEAGKYDDAKTRLTTYLAANPDDAQGNLLLGVADSFLKDSPGAADAFLKAGTIPPQYKTLALSAFTADGESLMGQKKYADVVKVAGKAVEIDPKGPNGYILRGVAEADLGDYASAVPDLEKAYQLALTVKTSDAQRAGLQLNLVDAYLGAGQFDKASAAAKEAVRLDPTLQGSVDQHVYSALNNAAVTAANAGKPDAAVALLEAAVRQFPGQASLLYALSAQILASEKPVDWKKVKAEADKSLAGDQSNGRANFLAALALAENKDAKGAVPYLTKAKSSATYTNDPLFAKQVDALAKAVMPAGSSTAAPGKY
jgi:TonB family protein